jgi:uncharacterized Zn finger protein
MAKRKSQSKRPSYDFYEYYPTSRPIKPAQGIASRSQRGAFASAWWAQRWIAVLESYGIGSRLQRGRSYARGGQVVSIAIQAGLVNARVQGSRPTPYQVEIKVKPLSAAEWEQAVTVISTQALFTAQLLDGTMPQEIETAFTAAQVPLFPSSLRDIQTSCSCPDYANPCKHVAAVYYLLGEQFDLDPFLIFTLRGRTREQVMTALRAQRASAAIANTPTELPLPEITIPALAEQLAEFWGAAVADWTPLLPEFPTQSAQALRRFDPPPYDLQAPLTEYYRQMSQGVLRRFWSEE